ncbi:LAFE_0F17458g1_1 [Lachancea fermentati]|uniref:LAFE_0F17458g1_1 n=1 Tax=Lachancea fermentati TaxID=4955 RepID=A0A1G4MG97_LACFM|nr:LAFE_0F17458g1_1 [Lachancea fermentati]
MAKRSREEGPADRRKKFRFSSGTLEPCVSGIYATCSRKHEKQAAQELGILFQEKLEEYYANELSSLNKNEAGDQNSEELSVEDQIKKELEALRSKPKGHKNKEILKFIDLNCECVIFCKTRSPIVPEVFVHKLMEEFSDPKSLQKRTRYVQKLTPITFSCNASLSELEKLCDKVLKPHFHMDNGVNYTFAIEITRRNFNTIDKMELIQKVASAVGKGGKYNHKVDLKNYDKLILVECFKNNIGMSVVDSDYREKFKKYNIQQIFEAKFKDQKENTEAAEKQITKKK